MLLNMSFVQSLPCPIDMQKGLPLHMGAGRSWSEKRHSKKSLRRRRRLEILTLSLQFGLESKAVLDSLPLLPDGSGFPYCATTD